MPKQATITASELQRTSGKILRRVAVDKERLIIERAGYPVAVVLPFEEYEELLRQQVTPNNRDKDGISSLSKKRKNKRK